MTSATQLFTAFIAMGVILIALEIIVPGGILGAFGALSLLIAIGMGFVAFGPQGGLLAALCVVLFSAAVLAAWIKLFPHTKMGKILTLQKDGSTFKSISLTPSPLIGKEGVALSNLHRAGIALIDGKRTDVLSETAFIAAGTPVKVVKVEGNRIIVREIQATPPKSSGEQKGSAV
ncbi:MAG: hypothetical protein NZ740_10045 [Kiritimatiellae bacterium]|nr:hypothetical protein [Kiritimatiellia bacterium]MDW8459434.1 NfeD family protein [Verrucomicrobiota bacterium]